MTGNDHLDRETSLSLEVTNSGVSAKAKSRFISAIDRLGGNLTETINVWFEEKTSLRRARIDGERKLIEAAVRYGQDRMQVDHAFADRVLENQFRKIASAQQNKDGVLFEAIQDLRRVPPSQIQAEKGPEELSAEFINRFEFYAEGATTDQLRERWGRVLASEIRAPGTFSIKVLRIVDEIDAETAHLFERVCSNLLDNVLVKVLSGELSFYDGMKLTNAGLIVDPSLGHIRKFAEVRNQMGTEIWMCTFGDWAIGYDKKAAIETTAHFNIGNPPSLDVYILTEAGVAISNILAKSQDETFLRLFTKLKSNFTENSLAAYKLRDQMWLDVTGHLHAD